MFRLQNELLDTWRDHRSALARRARLAAVDAAVLDTVGLGRRRQPRPTRRPTRADGADPAVDSMDVLLLVVAAALVPIAGLLAAADAAITMVSPARVEEMAREGRRGAAALHTITEDRPRYTNLLLLLRTGAEITATVMVAKVALSTWGFQFWVGVLLVAVMVVVTYVAIGVLPRTLGRQHPYAVGLAAGRADQGAGQGARAGRLAADPDRQRDHPRPRFPGGPVLLRHRTARAGRHRRQPRRGGGDRARDAAERLRSRRHHRPRGDGAAHRGGLDRGGQDPAAGAAPGHPVGLLPDPGGRRGRRRRARASPTSRT